jgi:hypothetical protein
VRTVGETLEGVPKFDRASKSFLIILLIFAQKPYINAQTENEFGTANGGRFCTSTRPGVHKAIQFNANS